jgi:FK506-binding protein 4/5
MQDAASASAATTETQPQPQPQQTEEKKESTSTASVTEKKEDVTMTDAKPEKKVEDITNDGGVLKEIIKEGTGWERPEKGSEVQVHYVGTLLDGTKFDSSRDRNEPFVFKLGEGQVIKGWDKGVKTMKKGEIAKFTIKPEYAYGKAGSPPKIPPDATLVFEIELISWTIEKDVSKKKDGGIIKKILREGSGWQQPNFEAKCVVNLVGRLPDGTVFEDLKNVTIVIGDEQVIPGLEEGLESMKKDEKARFVIKPQYAYGEAGCPEKNIPPNTTLTYEVELLNLTREKDSWDLDKYEEKWPEAIKRKEEGNELYKMQKYSRAARKYNKALDFFQYDATLTKEQKNKVNKELILPCRLNLAACYLILKNYKDVIEHTTKALEIEGSNVKALYRRGVAYTETDQWDLANQDLQRALELDPNNSAIKTAIAKLKKKIKIQDQKDKKVFSNLFDRLRKIEEQEKGTESMTTSDATTTPTPSNNSEKKTETTTSSDNSKNKATN